MTPCLRRGVIKIYYFYYLLDLESITMAVVSSATSVKPGEALRRQFDLDPAFSALPRDKQDQVFSRCVADYQRSIAEYETAAAQVAFEDPKAQAFAKDLSQRMADIIEAYSDVLDEENPPEYLHPAVSSQEFRRKQRLSQFFGNVSTNPGSVGMSPLAIEGAIKNGNLRERMTLVYQTIFSFLINEVLDKPKMIDKINEKLMKLPKERRFQIDKTLVELEKRDGTGVIASPAGKLVKQGPSVDQYRNVEKGRVSKKKARLGSGPQGPRVTEVRKPSEREVLVGTRYAALGASRQPAQPKLEWLGGKDWYGVSPTCTFAQQATALAQTTLTGPSGTADGILHIAKYVGMGDRMHDGVLACAAWMVPAQDHSLHEIRKAAAHYGVEAEYSGRPEDMTRFNSPNVQAKIDAILTEKGIRNPTYYVTSDHQQQVVRDLEKEIAGIEKELNEALAEASAQVEVGDYRRLDEPIQLRKQLHAFNVDLRQIEAMNNRLDQLAKGANANKLKAINERKKVLIDKYNQCMDRKIEFIQQKVRPENRIYAMSTPRVLKTGASVFKAGSREEINRILHAGGFAAFADSTRPAVQANSANGLGELGHYFLAAPPSEREEGQAVLRCRLNRDQEGAAIMSVPELRARGFTEREIEQGYAKLQTDYPFLQSDGLGPKDSEIVILNPEGHWTVGEWRQTDNPEESDTTWHFLSQLHPSWREGVAVRQSRPAAPALEIEPVVASQLPVEVVVSS